MTSWIRATHGVCGPNAADTAPLIPAGPPPADRDEAVAMAWLRIRAKRSQCLKPDKPGAAAGLQGYLLKAPLALPVINLPPSMVLFYQPVYEMHLRTLFLSELLAARTVERSNAARSRMP